MPRSPGPVVLLAFAAFALTLQGCSKDAPVVEQVRPVLTQVVGTRSGGAAAVYSGEVRPRYENDLAFRIGGKVVARTVEVGAFVRKGRVLARLDPQDQQLLVESARAQVASAEADLTLAKAELDRYRSLRDQNFVSQAVLDAKQNAFNAARARMRQVMAQLDVSRNTAEYTSLVAERDGIITAINVEAGQVVAAGQPVMRFARPEEKEVLVNVPESRLDEWKTAPGMFVSLWSDPGKRYAARVREVSPTADATTRTFNVRVSILDPDPGLRLGMTANVVLAAPQTAAPTVVVPLGAIGDRDGKPVVWVVDRQASTVQPVPVETGPYREDGVPIAKGLSGGELVVTAGVHKLLPGQKVRIEEDRRTVASVPAAPATTNAAERALSKEAATETASGARR